MARGEGEASGEAVVDARGEDGVVGVGEEFAERGGAGERGEGGDGGVGGGAVGGGGHVG